MMMTKNDAAYETPNEFGLRRKIHQKAFIIINEVIEKLQTKKK